MSGRDGDGRRALGVLGINPGEAPLVRWVAALFFVTQASIGVGINAADALFFTRFGVEHLPLMILISGAMVMLGILGYAAGLAWKGARSWLWPVPLAGAVVVTVERVGIGVETPGIYPVVWLAAQVVMMVTFTLMWNAAGEVCTTRQAKRLFPLFASAGIAGGVVGNALTGPAAELLGTENLLLLQAGLLVASGLLTLGTSRRHFADETGEPSSAGADLVAGMRTTWQIPLLRLVATATLALSILYFLVVFPFSEAVAASFDTESSVAGFLGVFSSVATAATFLVSLFIARALFTRLGIVVTLLIVPVVYATGFIVWLLGFTLVTASLVRGAQWIAINGIGATARNSLFNVLRGRRRAQVMAFVVAVPAQLGTVISGALLLVADDLPEEARFAGSAVLAVLAGVVVLRMRSAYRSALVDAVQGGLVDVFTAPTDGLQAPVLDADALHALESSLSDTRPARRRVAASILGHLGGSTTALRDRLDDEDPGVRIAALEAVGTADAASSMLDDHEPSVRLRAVEIGAGAIPAPAMSALLEDPDARVRAAAASAVGGSRGADVIQALLAESDPEALVAGLGAATATDVHVDPARLESLARHDDRRVRRAAATALGGTPRHEVLRGLLDDVSPGVRTEAGRALAAGAAGRAVLLDVLAAGTVRASDAALTAMVEAGAHPELRPWIDAEIDRATTLRRWAMAVEGAEATSARRYLASVLRARQTQHEGWVIQALEAEDPSLSAVRRGAWSDDAETRSQALEALESIADRTLARRLIDLMEGDGADGPAEQRTAYREMMADFDPWIRALAVRAFAEQILNDLESLQSAVTDDPSGLVREAAPTLQVGAFAAGGLLDRVLTLHEVPLFAELDPEELQLVARAVHDRRHGAGEIVFREGERGETMLVITRGSVEVRAGGAIVAVRRAGEFVGELSILRGVGRMADVVAGSDGVAGLIVASEAVHGLLEERPEAATAMLATLAARIAELLPDAAPA